MSNETKKTAVEWLIEQLEQHHVKIDIKNTVVYQQAKEMEKEQIKQARLDAKEIIIIKHTEHGGGEQ